VPSVKLSRLFCDRLQMAKNIVMPTIDSGHHPQGGKLKPTSKPDAKAAILRASAEVLNSARVIFIEMDLRFEAESEVGQFSLEPADVMRRQGC